MDQQSERIPRDYQEIAACTDQRRERILGECLREMVHTDKTRE